MPNTEELVVVEVVQGHIDQRALAWEAHKRGKNWIALVGFAPSQPGALGRIFWQKGSGSYAALPPALEVGDVIEVAADYYGASGGARPSRRFYRVVELSPAALVLQPVDKPDAHTLDAAAWRAWRETEREQERDDDAPLAAQWRTEAARLRETVGIIELCIAALEGRDGADVLTELAIARSQLRDVWQRVDALLVAEHGDQDDD